ncbi:ABC transporter permease [Dactylosporangium aurantiacum]|uniref:ABC transporter permease n=1 Tax=Dactylosporangium aurantiacum TaxID=35754 RepID=A0A9Q9I8M3_9ACTN|nr:ABC transporter permease [Dactylosporangium aurantiacum]MDG6107307.1 ABC transporter permease [Dactylosporangium aurantiacum]UWZ51166.1 ABC transporter permease [Dactylosporangium aurantiacum]
MSRYLRALRRPRGITGGVVLAGLALLALLVPVMAPGGYDAQGADAFAAPELSRPFGTDELGRDIFVRTLYGLRVDLSLVFVAVPLSAVLGTLLGLSGAVAPWLGALTQRALDVILGFPSLVLGICVALVLRPGWWALVVAIVVYGLPAFGRLARASLLAQQQREYVLAARVMRVPGRTIMLRHILPNAVDPVIVQTAIGMVAAVFLESSLSIVGLGIQPPEPSLGALLNVGMRHMSEQPVYVLGPALVLLLLALGLSLLADALNAAVNRT